MPGLAKATVTPSLFMAVRHPRYMGQVVASYPFTSQSPDGVLTRIICVSMIDKSPGQPMLLRAIV